jgi:glycosyltransferase involved in cell wall biosynthesis
MKGAARSSILDPSAIRLVLPSLKVSGGNFEAISLARDIETSDRAVDIVSMWLSPHALPLQHQKLYVLSNWKPSILYAFIQLPRIVLRFRSFIIADRARSCDWIFTHYATIPLALIVPKNRRWFFVQDLEWQFLQNNFLSKLLKYVMLLVYRRSQLIAANAYLESALEGEGLSVRAVAPIWADPIFDQTVADERDIDILLVLRKGGAKRVDLYLKAIGWLATRAPALRIAVITTEDEIYKSVKDKVTECHLRPKGRQAMAELYCRSKILIHLSDHEGFALPPLEAMGCGCVPICRNSGGPQAYMTGPMEVLLRPQHETLNDILTIAVELLKDPQRWGCLSSEAKRKFKEGIDLPNQRSVVLAKLFARNLPNFPKNAG